MGVMAIIGILAAVTLPSMISRIEDANSVGEDAKLEEIGRALIAGIKASGTIPNPNLGPVSVPGDPPTWTAGSWTAIAANYCSLAGYSLLNTRPANNQRQIVLSAGLAAYIAQNVGTYATDADGWPAALGNDMEIYILSSTKDGLGLMSDIPAADIKNWSKIYNTTTGRVEVPATILGAGNTTKGEFLHVKTIDVRSLFCAVTLTDFPIPTGGQTTFPGSGFTPGVFYEGIASGFSFNFQAPNASQAGVVGFNVNPGTVSAGVAVGSKSLIPRTGVIATTLKGTIAPPDLKIASTNVKNIIQNALLKGPYAAALIATNATDALAAVNGANINGTVSSAVPNEKQAAANIAYDAYVTANEDEENKQSIASAKQAEADAADPKNPVKDADAAQAVQAAALAELAKNSALRTYNTAQALADADPVGAAATKADNAATNAAYTMAMSFPANPAAVAPAAAEAAANSAAATVVTEAAEFDIFISEPPWWDISPPVIVGGQQMPTDGNNQTFYVLKGTTLALYIAGAALPAAPILTVQINADSKFEYFNGSWTRVD
jgi:hypothetical protein